jgi:hypothetical protein
MPIVYLIGTLLFLVGGWLLFSKIINAINKTPTGPSDPDDPDDSGNKRT